ncbi:TIGR02679 domain-containing protein [Streptomyces sp. JV185]|nr:TIGR02679 domain-containing protein [Streptomyces sp. JV185]MEE1767633.1 TIGR02679 domain-containing protein [Streptomyces sp. JV185]
MLLDPERTGTRGRGELAATTTGSAHGLDDGAWLARLVQRGVALAHDTDLPSNAAGRRALWRLVSVTPDEVSSTVLTYGLRPVGEGWRERSLRERAAHHAETHLTPRDLLDVDLQLPAGAVVHICENPRVVAAADAACASVHGIGGVYRKHTSPSSGGQRRDDGPPSRSPGGNQNRARNADDAGDQDSVGHFLDEQVAQLVDGMLLLIGGPEMGEVCLTVCTARRTLFADREPGAYNRLD